MNTRINRRSVASIATALLIAGGVLYGCGGPQGHDAEGMPHDHGDEASVDTTIWTENIELFVEYPAFVVGQTSRFAAHFTMLKDHKPVREGSVTASLIQGTRGIRHTVDTPSSPGIFTPALQPKEPGVYTLVFELRSAEISERIQIDGVRVYGSRQEAIHAHSDAEESAEAITFLKEQAWKIDFRTEKVQASPVYELIKTSGHWQPAPGAERIVQASAEGIVAFASGLLVEGMAVERGSLLAAISGEGMTSGNISIELARARSVYEQAEAEYKRKQPLYEQQIVSKAEFEEVKKRYEIARTEYENLSAHYRNGSKQIYAPLSGYVKRVLAGNGDFVRAGDPLVVLGVQHPVLLKVDVPVQYYDRLGSIRDVWFTDAQGEWTNLADVGGSLTSVGRTVSRAQPLVPVYFQAGMSHGIVEGSFTQVHLAAGESRSGILVPMQALLEEFGQYSVMVQISGEAYEKRPVQTGVRNGPLVEITGGLREGEHIVTAGAYQVKMASMAGQIPEHGHAH